MVRKPAKQRNHDKGPIPNSPSPAAAAAELAQIKQQAIALLQANRYAEAQQVYEQAVQADLTDASVYANLAALLQLAGRNKDSIPMLEQALILQPAYPEALLNLGNALQVTGRFQDAINSFRQAIALNPSLPEAHTGLGVALHATCEYQLAIEHHRQAISLRPAYPEAWSNLGYSLLHQVDGRQEAIAACRQAIRLRPEFPEALSNLGLALFADGQLEAGLASHHQAIGLRPSLPSSHLHLADGLFELNRLPEAIKAYNSAISIKPDYHLALTGLGRAYKASGALEEALLVLNRSLEIEPNSPEAHWIKIETLNELERKTEALEATNTFLEHHPDTGKGFLAKGVLLEAQKRYPEAHAALEHALSIDSSLYPAHYCLGWMLAREGKVQEAIDAYKQVLAIRPTHYDAASAVFYTELFCRGDEGVRIRNEAEQYWDQYPPSELPPFVAPSSPGGMANPAEPIRLLLLSGDIGNHAVSCFLEPLLRGLDRQRFELVLALTHRRNEPRARELEQLADGLLDLSGMGEAEAVASLRQQACAVAIDAAGWTSKNSLQLLRHRVAPVQCHYVGFCGTTGLSTIDYMIGDEVLTPPELQNQFTEKLWPLPRCWSTFSPTFQPPEITERQANQTITFGSFNNLMKVTDRCADFWAAALGAVPGSQLLLKDEHAEVKSVRERVEQALEKRGVAPERITFVSRVANWYEHMDRYNLVDIAIDTTPMTSATTGFEALCMGVPLLAIQTDWMGGRMSSSTLTALGRDSWIARDPEAFAANAAQLASEILGQPNSHFKHKLRQHFIDSPLSDGESLCRALEESFVQMLAQHANHND